MIASGCGWAVTEDQLATLPPRAALPSAQECADRAGRGHPEEVQENDRFNHVEPAKAVFPVWEDFTVQANQRFVSRIDGRFGGSTGEILAWGACKWGLDLDVLRAVAYQESDWKQATTGDKSDDPADCQGGAKPPCPTSFGILQLKATDLPGSYPHSQASTAFNVDYYGARMRACYEGWVTYLGADYAPGDLWSCVGWHWSGKWKDAGALNYIARVQRHLHNRSWTDLDHQT
ncbi:hypothetical protein [Pseudonocardia acaciae]|uniref:hypothetical protein n=1 Tax=Pseudonocardia acaciae TaxID=551276 RepID=UPI00048BEED3|nr:hypothetical protein [Pseudonocardia acaciae]